MPVTLVLIKFASSMIWILHFSWSIEPLHQDRVRPFMYLHIGTDFLRNPPSCIVIIISCVHKKFNLSAPGFPYSTIYSFWCCAFCHHPLEKLPNISPIIFNYIWNVINIFLFRYVKYVLKYAAIFSIFAPFAINLFDNSVLEGYFMLLRLC